MVPQERLSEMEQIQTDRAARSAKQFWSEQRCKRGTRDHWLPHCTGVETLIVRVKRIFESTGSRCDQAEGKELSISKVGFWNKLIRGKEGKRNEKVNKPKTYEASSQQMSTMWMFPGRKKHRQFNEITSQISPSLWERSRHNMKIQWMKIQWRTVCANADGMIKTSMNMERLECCWSRAVLSCISGDL